MKTVIAIIVMFVGGFFVIDYCSKYMLGGIEGGMPGGGHGKFADFHEDNLFSYFLSDYDEEYKPSFLQENTFTSDVVAAVPTDVEGNPFVTADQPVGQ